jgi:ribosomal protein S6--L-glutamate ligase
MRVLILSRGLWIHATGRLFREARLRGHRVRVLDPGSAIAGLGPGPTPVAFRAEPSPVYDAAIPRLSPELQPAGLAQLAALQAAGVTVQNAPLGILLASDKFLALAALQADGLPVPATVAARRGDHVAGRWYRTLGEGPLVVKSRTGTQGGAVLKAPEPRAAAAILQALGDAGVPAMLQEYVAEAAGRDTRLFVVHDRVVAAMQRRAPPGDFRSNVHRGGTCVGVDPTRELQELAVRAARVVGLRVAGVDILQSSRGPLLLEVNASPGLQGVEEATGQNVAAAIIEDLELQVASAPPAGVP